MSGITSAAVFPVCIGASIVFDAKRDEPVCVYFMLAWQALKMKQKASFRFSRPVVGFALKMDNALRMDGSDDVLECIQATDQG